MTVKTPIRTVFDGSNNATGLAEFQSGEFIGLTHGGLGASLSLGTAGQVLKVNTGATALEFGNVEAVINVDGMTDGSGITVADSDKLIISDAGTEKYILASQLRTYVQTNTGNTPITNLDIDGGTDIGADLAAADLIIVDDGAGGTNRKATIQRLTDHVHTTVSGGTGISASASSNVLTIAIDTGTTVDLSTSQTLTNKTLTTPVITEIDSGSTITLDATTDIVLDADSGVVKFSDGGTQFGSITKSGNDLRLVSSLSDGDLVFRGNDGGAGVTALTLDMSEAGNASFNNDVTVGQDLAVTRNATITGNLTVNGTTTTVSSTNTTISDNLLELNSGASSNSNDSGIIIERGSTGDNAIIAWDESADKFTLGTTTATASSTGNITITTGTLVASTFEGNLTGDVTGNADTATTLATARNIAGQSFDGSANITIASTDLSNTSNITLNDATQTLTNKTLTSPTLNTPTLSSEVSLHMQGSDISFEGSTDDDYETTLTVTDPTADRTITFPNATGNVAVFATAATAAITDGSAGQFLKTDGSGALSFATVSTDKLNESTLTIAPGSTGDYDLAEDSNQNGTDESPFEASADDQDAFGITITGNTYSFMDPANQVNSTDLGALS